MKTTLLPLILFICTSTWAAGVPEKHPTDSFQIGVGSSSSQKNFLFDLGLGASNPTLGVDTSVSGLNYSKNVIQFGDGTSSIKSFIANVGSGASNPKIVWSSTNSDWEFSNDGTNFTSIGSGSGGASGVQLLDNGGYESGITLDWSNTGGTFAVVTGGANLLIGKRSATFTASAGSQSVQSGLHTVPNGLQAQACVASMMYKGGDTGLTFEALDNSSNILASQVLQTATTPQVVSLPFLCPSSGSIRLKVLSSSSASLVAIDQMFLGQNTISQVSQATLYGTLTITGGCAGGWTTTSTTYANMGTNTGCTYAVTGNAKAPSPQVNGISFDSLPPGNYAIEYNGTFYQATSAKVSQYRLTDGTTVSSEAPILFSASGGELNVPTLGIFGMNYTTAQSNVTFELQGKTDSGGTTLASSNGEVIKVWRYPSSSELAVRPETINWKVDVQQYGTNPAIAVTGTLSSFTEITDAGSTLTTAALSGSLPVQVPCSGTNPSTGTTCGAGTPDLGVVFNLPAAGSVLACVQFTDLVGTGTSGVDGFDIIETPNNDQTILQQTNSGAWVTQQSGNLSQSFNACGVLNFSSSGQKTLRLMYETAITGTWSQHLIPADATNGRQVHWTIRPLTQSVPAPVLVGSVIQEGAGVEKIVRLTSDVSSCSSSPCTINTSNGFSTVTRGSTGNYIANFTNAFGSQPTCSVTSGNGNIFCAANPSNVLTTYVGFSCVISTTGAAADASFSVMCIGGK